MLDVGVGDVMEKKSVEKEEEEEDCGKKWAFMPLGGKSDAGESSDAEDFK